MVNRIILCLAVAVCLHCVEAQETYKAAVVEYSPYETTPNNIEMIMLQNTAEYKNHIINARNQGAEIVVFPEYGLTSLNGNGSMAYATLVPHPSEKISPCNTNSNYSKVLIDISCYAKTSQIYVAVNLIEKNKTEEIFYNTNVVFDREGTVVARYRKINPFNEPTITPGDEIITFETDFGVKFGVFICFDILFHNPAKKVAQDVGNILYSTAWFSETPFLTAISAQSGYSRANGVNLLASGYSRPEKENGGSGIYSANGEMSVVIPISATRKLIVFDVPKNPSKAFRDGSNNTTKGIIGQNPNINNFITQKENMTNYTFRDINMTNITEQTGEICENKACCYFNVTLKSTSNVFYKFVMRVGTRFYGEKEYLISTCGLVLCENNEISSCGARVSSSDFITFESIKIGGLFSKQYPMFHFPSTLRRNMESIPNSEYTYTSTEEKDSVRVEMSSNYSQSSLLTFGIYGRIDPINSTSLDTFGIIGRVHPINSASFLCVNLIMMLVPILFINLRE